MKKKNYNTKIIINDVINKTSVILENKKKLLSKNNSFLTQNTKKINTIIHNKNITNIITKKYIPHHSITNNILQDTEKKRREKAYIIMKKDIHVQELEKKFDIEWTEENINIL